MREVRFLPTALLLTFLVLMFPTRLGVPAFPPGQRQRDGGPPLRQLSVPAGRVYFRAPLTGALPVPAENLRVRPVADGQSGRMQMYVFTGSAPDRDGSLDPDIVLHELTPQKASLEDAYMRLTGDSVEYRTHPTGPASNDKMELVA